MPLTRVMKTVPDRLITKLRYAYSGAWSVPGGTTWFNGAYFQNSLFQPQLPVGVDNQHQPMYFDQWCPALYEAYRVYGIKYHVRVNNHTINETWFVGVDDNPSQTPSTDIRAALERPQWKVKTGGQQYSSSNHITISGYLDVAKTLGIPRQQVLYDDKFQKLYNESPESRQTVYIVPYIMHKNPAEQSFDVVVRLTYYVIFEERVEQAKS